MAKARNETVSPTVRALTPPYRPSQLQLKREGNRDSENLTRPFQPLIRPSPVASPTPKIEVKSVPTKLTIPFVTRTESTVTSLSPPLSTSRTPPPAPLSALQPHKRELPREPKTLTAPQKSPIPQMVKVPVREAAQIPNPITLKPHERTAPKLTSPPVPVTRPIQKLESGLTPKPPVKVTPPLPVTLKPGWEPPPSPPLRPRQEAPSFALPKPSRVVTVSDLY